METDTSAIPDEFARFIATIWGGEGVVWLRDLPALLAEFGVRWGLTLAPPFPGLSYNYVAPATRADGSPAVLKAGVPRDEIERRSRRCAAAMARVWCGCWRRTRRAV